MSEDKLRNLAKIPGMSELIGTMGVDILNEIADSYSEMYEALKAVIDEGDEGCCEECMCKDAIAKHALAKAEGRDQ